MDERNNSGHYNSGHYNSGHYNSGNYNSGHYNSGNYNSGDCNSGDCNSGHYNSGNCNSGHYNSGHYNSGNYNSGDCNSGDCNSGHYNSGHYSSGFFCVGTPTPQFFDLPAPAGMTWDQARDLIPFVELPVGCQWVSSSQMTDEEKAANPNHTTIGGYLKVLPKDFREAFPIAWAKLDDETRQRFLSLPNFDAEKFLAITGVDVRKPEPPKEIVVDGRKYVLA